MRRQASLRVLYRAKIKIQVEPAQQPSLVSGTLGLQRPGAVSSPRFNTVVEGFIPEPLQGQHGLRTTNITGGGCDLQL